MRFILTVALTTILCVAEHPYAENDNAASPRAQLVSASVLRFTGDVDSNSPAVWDIVAGRSVFFLLTSTAGHPSIAAGSRLQTLSQARRVEIDPRPGGGIWMEAVVKDVDGTWYGYYHNENVGVVCDGTQKALPRIAAARSRNQGLSWEPLGVVLEAPPNSEECATSNTYFVGGVGDFSVQLDHDSRDVYVYYSQYLRSQRQQGVAIARLAWADRDQPTGRIMVWRVRTWIPASEDRDGSVWVYPAAAPIFRAAESWHDDADVDAFWGPSVHWNTHLQQYVMLLNRAEDATWRQEGVYISYAPRLDDPRAWSMPVKILSGGSWYPQVMGLEGGVGTDKVAGELARLFVSGVSRHLIRFVR
jgi:hypothetical protein